MEERIPDMERMVRLTSIARISLIHSIEYGMPVDESEQDRLDLQHCKYTLLLEGKFFLAPISDNPQKILDLGAGTGSFSFRRFGSIIYLPPVQAFGRLTFRTSSNRQRCVHFFQRFR